MNASTLKLSVFALTVDCDDPAALAAFWGEVLDRPVTAGSGPENAVVEATSAASGPKLFFVKVPESKAVKNRLHLDLITERYAEELERLAGLGGKPLDEVTFPGIRWTTFADPEGNEFDLITMQS